MIIYRRTSLLESSAQTLVNTVNCVGVMGKGLAHAFKEREPEMFAAYKRICDQHLLEPGKLWLWKGAASWVLNFPTKQHWRNPSRLEWVEAGLKKFVSAYEAQGITEVSFPQLGCGNGNLDWNDVRPLMEQHLSQVNIPVYIHDYTVNIGLPEYLEPVAKTLRDENAAEPSFETFVHAIRRAVDLAGSGLVDIESQEPFAARMPTDDDLTIETGGASLHYEKDDLRGVWLGLQQGIVTRKEAGWAVREGSRQLLTLLSLLPDVRPIQIQRAGGSAPEVAVELAPSARFLANASQSREQHEFAWR